MPISRPISMVPIKLVLVLSLTIVYQLPAINSRSIEKTKYASSANYTFPSTYLKGNATINYNEADDYKRNYVKQVKNLIS